MADSSHSNPKIILSKETRLKFFESLVSFAKSLHLKNDYSNEAI